MFISVKNKSLIRKIYFRINRIITNSFFSYDKDQLKNALLQMGIKEGDTIFLHSAFSYFNGFKGNPQDVINCLVEILGKDGNLLMVSMSYICSSYEYLIKNPLFDVRKTPSKMGIISEIFRRKKGVLRSLHSTHPVLAYGKDAEWLVEGHEKCLIPCGKDSPFDKFRSLKGKVLHFDVPFHGGFTFIHYLEDIIKEKLPFPLYTEEPISARMVDNDGKEIEIKTYVFSKRAVETRRVAAFGDHLSKHRVLKYKKIGKTRLLLISAEDAVLCTEKMMADNIVFFANNEV